VQEEADRVGYLRKMLLLAAGRVRTRSCWRSSQLTRRAVSGL